MSPDATQYSSRRRCTVTCLARNDPNPVTVNTAEIQPPTRHRHPDCCFAGQGELEHVTSDPSDERRLNATSSATLPLSTENLKKKLQAHPKPQHKVLSRFWGRCPPDHTKSSEDALHPIDNTHLTPLIPSFMLPHVTIVADWCRWLTKRFQIRFVSFLWFQNVCLWFLLNFSY